MNVLSSSIGNARDEVLVGLGLPNLVGTRRIEPAVLWIDLSSRSSL